MGRTQLRLLTGIALLLSAIPVVAAESAVVLMYHRFGEDRYPSTSIRTEQFEAQLAHLRDTEANVIPLADLLATLNGGAALPDRAVVITIDDAYRSVYDVAWPRFKEYQFPFTVFVATDAVDRRLPAFMNWDQMREMQAAGVSFANHGATHDSFVARREGESTADRLARLAADVEKGQLRLEEELEPLTGVFAYPYGEYDPTTAEMLRSEGFVAFGQHSGAVGPTSDRRALPRFPISESFGDLERFRTKVASLPMPVSSVGPWNPVVDVPLPSIEVILGRSIERVDELACFVSGQGNVPVQWTDERKRFRVGPASPLTTGRHRVNCTAPREDGRYLWFSHPWIVVPKTTKAEK